MSNDRQVYLLDPQKLPPETIAVTFAKTSRSPQTFHEIAQELTDEKSAEFHEKWVVGYGHASVAEHAVLHIAVENISRLAVEMLESCRLASYTEKSTRYQKWTLESYYIPPELEGHPLKTRYIETCQKLFQAYQESLPVVRQVIEKEFPRQDDESDAAWERRIRSKYVDVCRFYLPAASLANVGMTINARALENLISKMLSHPLEEVRQVGAELKKAGQSTTPTLVKYANPLPYLERVQKELPQLISGLSLPEESVTDWCQLIDYNRELENRVLAAALYRFGEFSYTQALNYIFSISPAERAQIAHLILSEMDKFTIPIRELEYASYTFDLFLDQGGYFELKRHRMMTQTPQHLTTHLGYAVPRRIMLAGLENHFSAAMEAAARCYDEIAAWNPQVASYIVPNGFNRRVLLEMNLRSANHFLALRSAPNAHFSLRRVAQRMVEQIRAATPLLGSYLRTNPGETWQEIEQEHFYKTA